MEKGRELIRDVRAGKNRGKTVQKMGMIQGDKSASRTLHIIRNVLRSAPTQRKLTRGKTEDKGGRGNGGRKQSYGKKVQGGQAAVKSPGGKEDIFTG